MSRKKKTYEDEIPESVWQARVVQVLRMNGCRITPKDALRPFDLIFHVRDSRSVISRGFPDLVAIQLRKGKVGLWMLELKRNTGRLRPEQKLWKRAFERLEEATGGVIRYRVLRPRDLDAFVEEIGGYDPRLVA